MLTGDEKRIRALFCELAFEDQSDTPRFEKLWHCAELTAPSSTTSVSSVRSNNWPSLKFTTRKLVVVTTILVATILLSLGLELRSRKEEQPKQELVSVPGSTALPVPASEEKTRDVVSSAPAKFHVYKAARKRTRDIAKDAIVQKAETLSSWQSPTASLLESPASPVLNSQLQLNQSLRELELFLPNGEKKESNQ